MLVAVAGCVGTIGGDGGGAAGKGSTGTDEQGLCAGSPATGSLPLRRLSHLQYETVLGDVLETWASPLRVPVMTSAGVEAGLARLRADNRVTLSNAKHGGFRRIDQDVAQDQVDTSVAVALAVGKELTHSTERIGALLGPCATDADPANDAACVRDFIRRAGRAAHRRPLEDADLDFYTSVYAAPGIDPEGLADVITTLLSGPYFFYQVEHGGDVVDEAAKRFALTGEELANRLALQFWNSIPDDRLRAIADSGRMLTPQGFAEAVSYVAESPRTSSFYRELFREYLSAEDLPEIDSFVGTPAFEGFLAGFKPHASTRENMIEEVTRLATHYATKPDGKFSDLFTTHKSFATTPDVAAIYGVAPWSGEGEPPDMPDPERVGFLTHAALLATGSPTTRPIIKGVFVRSAFLCEDLPPPPANAFQIAQDSEVNLQPVMSQRARVDAITSRPDCASCHARLINPLGFLTEGFDALGRSRKSERVFDQAGLLLGEIPVDATAVPYVTSDDPTPAKGPADLARLLVASKKAQTCLATKYFRYTFARIDDSADACLIKALGDGFVADKPLRSVLMDITRGAAFRQRTFD